MFENIYCFRENKNKSKCLRSFQIQHLQLIKFRFEEVSFIAIISLTIQEHSDCTVNVYKAFAVRLQCVRAVGGGAVDQAGQ